VGWGKEWGKRSKSDWRLPIDGHVASDHDELHGIARCIRLVEASHELLPDVLRKLGFVSKKSAPALFTLPHLYAASQDAAFKVGYSTGIFGQSWPYRTGAMQVSGYRLPSTPFFHALR
jgi:hypothetical protein